MTDEGPEIKIFVGLSSPCTAIFAIFFLNVSVETNSIFLSNISKQKQKKPRLAALSILAVDWSIFVADWNKYANVYSFLEKANNWPRSQKSW